MNKTVFEEENDIPEEEIEMYKQQIEEEFFESVRKGENLTLYLYVPYVFLTEKVKEHLDTFLIEEAYFNLFVAHKESWTVYDDGYMVTMITDDKYKIELFEKMMTHYTEKEDYTKCAVVKKEYDKLCASQK